MEKFYKTGDRRGVEIREYVKPDGGNNLVKEEHVEDRKHRMKCCYLRKLGNSKEAREIYGVAKREIK